MKYLPALALLTGCSTLSDGLSAVDELALSATTGAEESVLGGTMSPAAIPADERPDPFRACDASGGFADLFARYDADGDGRLDVPEEDEVFSARADRSEEHRAMVMAQWAMLVTIYDTDGDGAIGESERAALLDDFTARCEAIQALLLADFDADGDGTLSEDEQATARAAIEEEMAGHHPPAPPEGSEGPPEAGAAPPIPPPLLEEFDADGDGALSDAERITLQETMRARIRAGERLCGM